MARKWNIGKDLGLNVGDKVYWGDYLTEVVGKTPTGQLKIKATTTRFYEDGKPVVGYERYRYVNNLSPWTPEIEAEKNREREHLSAVRDIENAIYRWNWRRASLEDIQAVREIIGPYLNRK